MSNIPRQLKSSVPLREIFQVENWWNKLSAENQTELQAFYEEDQVVTEQMVSIYLCGKYVEQDITNTNDVFWINHFYDYIINHELHIDHKPTYVGGICSSNKVAEQVIRKGLIPKHFKCPLLGDACLMMNILDLENKNKSFQFYLKFEMQ